MFPPARCSAAHATAPALFTTPSTRLRDPLGARGVPNAASLPVAAAIGFAAASRRRQRHQLGGCARMPAATMAAQKRTAARATSSCKGAAGTAETTAIVPDRARYHVFEMDGVDFLIGAGDDGRLDVRDAFVCDSTSNSSSSFLDDEEQPATPSYFRAEGHDSLDLPQQPLPYVAVPWELRFDGDTLYKKPAWSKLLKVYLIAAERTEPSLRLDLTNVVSLDAATRTVKREEVINRATSDDPEQTTLRIRAECLMLVDVESLPSPDDIIDGRDDSIPKVVKEEKKRRKPFWFQGTFRLDEDGNEVERIRDERWEDDFGDGEGSEEEKKEKKNGEEDDLDDMDLVAKREAEKSSWLSETSPEAQGGGREGWE